MISATTILMREYNSSFMIRYLLRIRRDTYRYVYLYYSCSSARSISWDHSTLSMDQLEKVLALLANQLLWRWY